MYIKANLINIFLHRFLIVHVNLQTEKNKCKLKIEPNLLFFGKVQTRKHIKIATWNENLIKD